MRIVFKVFVMAAMGLGAACGADEEGTTADSAGDAGEVATEVVGTEVASEGLSDGTVPSDTPDVLPDASVDASEETAPEETSACAPLDCALACPNGFQHDAAGCDVCACRECDAPSDCAAVIDCAKPECSDAGTCLCDCEGVVPEAYACPDGDAEVPFCACAARGWSCMEHPEYACPTLCSPQETDAWPCPDGTSVTWCTCEMPTCEPVCQHVGAANEGWYDGCSGALVREEACGGCQPVCRAIGTRSEGWYTSCGGALIDWAMCSPQRDCVGDPGSACTSLDCTIAQETRYVCPNGSTTDFCACASGTWDCEAAPWDACTGGLPLPLGAVCGDDDACASELMCLKPLGGALIGVCSRVCTPSAGADVCGPGAVCGSLAGFAAPGFCLVACDTRGDCDAALGCGTHTFGGTAAPSGCFFWPPCDPLTGVGCGDEEQCRVAVGEPVCGLPGTLARGDKCDRASDRCGPGLACGALDTCWPTCADDDACRALQLDFCLKSPSDAPFGHCMFLE